VSCRWHISQLSQPCARSDCLTQKQTSEAHLFIELNVSCNARFEPGPLSHVCSLLAAPSSYVQASARTLLLRIV
jgi:hypothetical protein